ncbi:thermonuclease family protein [Nocardioides sp. SYSU D00038]|uniref:thermonuclease family protein n=1 Tax=Nocardioides sp. SYSU D00038 TaxID=2812554 RepID=UPI00196744A2|nr:thermonuclease family protein [Nocardioides sp. SYSU D00038]
MLQTLAVRALTALLAVSGALVAFAAAPAQAADRDCGDFANQAAAQQFYVANGGPHSDPHNLDSEGDGLACETLPCPCSTNQGGGGQPAPATPPRRQPARIVSVLDGDTVVVRFATGRRATVRLVGVDTPELRGPECGAVAASRLLRKVLPVGTRVVLVVDGPQPDKDKHGRLLRYVLKNGGKDVGLAQLRRGMARVLVVGRSFERRASYRSTESTARRTNRGSWKTCW